MKIKGALIVICSVIASSVIGGAIISDHDHDHDAPGVNAHSGGLDSCGGHYDHSTGLYHYHQYKC